MAENGEGLIMKYFVLNPNKQNVYGIASREAIRAYASCILKENPKLANDLFDWIDRIILDKEPK